MSCPAPKILPLSFLLQYPHKESAFILAVFTKTPTDPARRTQCATLIVGHLDEDDRGEEINTWEEAIFHRFS